MDPSQLLKLALAVFFVLLNGWFVLAEFALVKVRKTRLQELSDAGTRGAKRALNVTQHLDRYLSAIQLGITLASLALGWLGEPAIARLLAPALAVLPGTEAVTRGVSITVAFVLITFMHVVLGEMAPKTMAIQSAERFALAVAGPLHFFYRLTSPIIILLQGASNKLVKLFGFQSVAEGSEAHSEEELRMIVAASHRGGVLDESTRDLLDNVFQYQDRIVREVMQPRRDIAVLDIRTPLDAAIEQALTKEYTRYPLLDSDTDRVLGFVHVKDLMSVATGRRKITSLLDVARQPVFVPETVAIDRVRRQLQARRTHFGIVVDEFGDFTGIVTLEDLLEELVGEIQDELDAEQPKILRRIDGSVDVDGALLLETAVKKLDLHVTDEAESVDTLGGYVFALLGRAPLPGDQVDVNGHRIEVLQVDELRIRRVRIRKREGEPVLGTDPANDAEAR